MNSLKGEKIVLLIMDMQKAFDNYQNWGGNRNNPNLEYNTLKLLEWWRKEDFEVIHSRHDSINEHSLLHPKSSGNAFKEDFEPLNNEKIFAKNVNSAFIGTDLDKYLKDNNYNHLVIAGLTTNHCVSTTARMAGNLGYNTFVLSDCTATFNIKDTESMWHDSELVHQISLANLHDEFAEVLSMAELVRRII